MANTEIFMNQQPLNTKYRSRTDPSEPKKLVHCELDQKIQHDDNKVLKQNLYNKES